MFVILQHNLQVIPEGNEQGAVTPVGVFDDITYALTFIQVRKFFQAQNPMVYYKQLLDGRYLKWTIHEVQVIGESV